MIQNLKRFNIKAYYFTTLDIEGDKKGEIVDLNGSKLKGNLIKLIGDAEDSKCFIMQSTGMTSFNGEEVFEGYVLTDMKADYICEYNEDSARVILKNIADGSTLDVSLIPFLTVKGNKFEI